MADRRFADSRLLHRRPWKHEDPTALTGEITDTSTGCHPASLVQWPLGPLCSGLLLSAASQDDPADLALIRFLLLPREPRPLGRHEHHNFSRPPCSCRFLVVRRIFPGGSFNHDQVRHSLLEPARPGGSAFHEACLVLFHPHLRPVRLALLHRRPGQCGSDAAAGAAGHSRLAAEAAFARRLQLKVQQFKWVL